MVGTSLYCKPAPHWQPSLSPYRYLYNSQHCKPQIPPQRPSLFIAHPLLPFPPLLLLVSLYPSALIPIIYPNPLCNTMSTSQILKRATSASMRSPVRRCKLKTLHALLPIPEPALIISTAFHDTDRRPAILMPAMSPFMTDGTITRWIKKEGDAFEVGEVLLQIVSVPSQVFTATTNNVCLTGIRYRSG